MNEAFFKSDLTQILSLLFIIANKQVDKGYLIKLGTERISLHV